MNHDLKNNKIKFPMFAYNTTIGEIVLLTSKVNDTVYFKSIHKDGHDKIWDFLYLNNKQKLKLLKLI